ncbi:hypothetical protein M404DRAFT_57506, partial [Pisolithus tinctorius Marx 270]
YLKHCLQTTCSPFFPSTEIITNMLSACDAVISGSAALRMILPANACNWAPSNLDIYVARNSSTQLYNLLQKQDYHLVSQCNSSDGDYPPSTIFTVSTFGNGHKHIDVIVSKTTSALSPIFQFHSTAVMNFFSANSLFCAYPSLTLRHHAMIN